MKEEHVSNANSSTLSAAAAAASAASTTTTAASISPGHTALLSKNRIDCDVETNVPGGESERKSDLIMKIAKSPNIDDPLFRDLRGNLKDRLRLTLLKSLNYGIKSTELLVHESIGNFCDFPSSEYDMNLILEVVVRRIVNAFADCSKLCALPGVLQSAMMRKVISKAMLLRSIFHYHQNVSLSNSRYKTTGDVDEQFNLLPLEIKAIYHSCLSVDDGKQFLQRYIDTSHQIPRCLKEDVPILVFIGIYWMFESFFKLIPSRGLPCPTSSSAAVTSAPSSSTYASSSKQLPSSTTQDNSSNSIHNEKEFISILSSNDTQDIVYSEWFAIGQFLHRYVCRLYGLEAYQEVISSSTHIEQLGIMYEHLAIANGQNDFFNIQTITLNPSTENNTIYSS